MPDSTIKTARRIFEVLEHFEQVRRPVSLKEISKAYGYPTSSGSALLKSMVALGYLHYDSYNRTYIPTMRVAQMGGWLKSELFGEESILALVDHVFERVDELVNISAQSDLYAQYLHCVQTSKRLRFEVRPGDIRPLARCGVGRALLSTHTDAEIERLVRRINATCPAEEHMDLGELMKIVGGVRRDGYIISCHIVTQDAGVIAMPLPQRSYGRTFVLGVGGPVTRLEENQDMIIATMREAIDRFMPG